MKPIFLLHSSLTVVTESCSPFPLPWSLTNLTNSNAVSFGSGPLSCYLCSPTETPILAWPPDIWSSSQSHRVWRGTVFLSCISWTYNLDDILTLDFPLYSQVCVNTFPVASPRHSPFPAIHKTKMLFCLMPGVLQHLLLGRPSLGPPLLIATPSSFPAHHDWACLPPIFSLDSLGYVPPPPSVYRRTLRQGLPQVHISAAAGSWAMTAGPRTRIATACKLIPAQVSRGQKWLCS